MPRISRDLQPVVQLSDHVQRVMLEYFELSAPHRGDLDSADRETYLAYARDLIAAEPSLTHEQRYLRSLQSLIDPAVSAASLKNRIRRLQPRTHRLNATDKFEELGQRLSMEAYHFGERLRLFGQIACDLIPAAPNRKAFSSEIGRIIREYKKCNARLLKFRNFVVHGPRSDADEFAQLRGTALYGEIVHDDLWLVYNELFYEAQSEWVERARSLVTSIKAALEDIQAANHAALSDAWFVFVPQSPGFAQTPKTAYSSG